MNSLLRELIDMHTYQRPYQSRMEQAFRDCYIRPLGATDDTAGNLHVVIGESDTLFSSHTDTVHFESGRQTVDYRVSDGRLQLSKRARRYSDCLGADDTVGVFLMRQMILAGVPGRYVFHSGEEMGCIGSQTLADHATDLLSNYRMAIAFDRKGFSDIITHQCGRRTASDVFADALADSLRAEGLMYAASSHGLYTDTESYRDLIPECTNLSIGYAGNHGRRETVDTHFVLRLLDGLVSVDWAALPSVREPFSTHADHLFVFDGRLYDDWPDDDDDPTLPDLTLPVVARSWALDPEYEEVQQALLSRYYQQPNRKVL